MEVLCETCGETLRGARSRDVPRPDAPFFATVGSGRATGTAAGRDRFSRPRPGECQGDPAQPRLGLALLGGAPVQPRRQFVRAAGLLVQPHQSHPPQLDGGRDAGSPCLSHRRSARPRHAAARRLVTRFLDRHRKPPPPAAEQVGGRGGDAIPATRPHPPGHHNLCQRADHPGTGDADAARRTSLGANLGPRHGGRGRLAGGGGAPL